MLWYERRQRVKAGEHEQKLEPMLKQARQHTAGSVRLEMVCNYG